jgi:hypothetical protein
MHVGAGRPPEEALLILCARTRLEPERTEEVRGLARAARDWPRALRLARQHGVVPLLHRHLSSVAADVPAPVLSELRGRAVANAWRNLALTDELLALMAGLAAEGVRALPYKGPALAQAAYGSVTLRQFADLDILVTREQIGDARAALLARGYRDAVTGLRSGIPLTKRAHYQHEMVRDADRTRVELHWALAPRYHRLGLEIAELAVETMPLGASTVQTIAPSDLLVLLCAHGGRHLWTRLAWIADLAALLGARPDARWQDALDRATALRVRRMLLVGLGLARALLGADLPGALAGALAEDATAVRLVETFAGRLFAQDGAAPPLFVAARLHLTMRERWADRAVYGLLGAFTPSERDTRGRGAWRAVARPFRLIRDFGLWNDRA